MKKGMRMNRIDSEVQKHLAKIISNFDDVEISSTIISILKVETFSDFSMSKIYISVLGGDDKKKRIVELLNKNKKSIRYDLAHEMKLRVVPELQFIADDFEEKSQRVLKLFEKIESEHSSDSDDTSEEINDEE